MICDLSCAQLIPVVRFILNTALPFPRTLATKFEHRRIEPNFCRTSTVEPSRNTSLLMNSLMTQRNKSGGPFVSMSVALNECRGFEQHEHLYDLEGTDSLALNIFDM